MTPEDLEDNGLQRGVGFLEPFGDNNIQLIVCFRAALLKNKNLVQSNSKSMRVQTKGAKIARAKAGQGHKGVGCAS